jgi:hypothetical protein
MQSMLHTLARGRRQKLPLIVFVHPLALDVSYLWSRVFVHATYLPEAQA